MRPGTEGEPEPGPEPRSPESLVSELYVAPPFSPARTDALHDAVDRAPLEAVRTALPGLVGSGPLTQRLYERLGAAPLVEALATVPDSDKALMGFPVAEMSHHFSPEEFLGVVQWLGGWDGFASKFPELFAVTAPWEELVPRMKKLSETRGGHAGLRDRSQEGDGIPLRYFPEIEELAGAKDFAEDDREIWWEFIERRLGSLSDPELKMFAHRPNRTGDTASRLLTRREYRR